MLPACLDALNCQDWRKDRLEIIVVDDGSTDQTPHVAKSYPIEYYRQNNAGPAAARNLGAEKASGDILLFTDADCIPNPDWVTQMVTPILENPDVVGVKGKYRTIQRGIIPRMIQLEFEERYRKLNKRRDIDFIDSHSAAFRKSEFVNAGGFDPEFPRANNEDVDLSYRIANGKGRMLFNPNAVVTHTHPNNLNEYLRTKFSRAFWRMLVYRKHPKKAATDSYTPQTMKMQIVFCWALLLSFLTWMLFPVEGKLPLKVFAIAFGLMCLPFWVSGITRDPLITIISLPLLILRALSFGAGVFLGIVFLDRRSSWIRTGLILSDYLFCFLSMGAAYYIRTNLIPYPEHFSYPANAYLVLAAVLPLVLILANWQQGLYRVRSSSTDFHHATRIFKAHLILAMITMTGFYLLKLTYSRLTLFLFLGISLVLISSSRWLFRKLWIQVLKRGINQSRVLIVGTGETSQLLMEKLLKFPELGYKVVGVISDNDTQSELRGIPILGDYRDIPNVVHHKHVHEVIIADPLVSREKTLELILQIGRLNLPVKIVSNLYEIITTRTELNGFADIPIIEIPTPKAQRVRNLIKNVLEYILTIILFLVSLPLWILIWAAIRFSSRGPAIFRQERIGKDGKPFKIYKFRTMYQDVNNYEEAPRDKMDPRITKVGRLIRRTSLDELPQLLNVLRGEMSLVGPRPEMPFIVDQYNDWQRIRLSIKPGLTGLWQILGRKDLYLHENLEYDFFYIKNQSILLDLIILLKTIPAVLKGKGAY